MPAGLEIDGAGGLHRIDVLGPDVDEIRLAQLQEAHLRHFPEHAHVADEMAAAFAGGSFDPEVVVHQWLLLLDDGTGRIAATHQELANELGSRLRVRARVDT